MSETRTLRDDIADLMDSHKFEGQTRTGRRRSAMLYLASLDGGTDEIIASLDEDGVYIATTGRWLLIEDDHGFFEAIRCATPNDAANTGEGIAAGQ